MASGEENGVTVWWLLASSWARAPSPVLALGDGLVAGEPEASASASTVPGGWVAILGDCLEERSPGTWTVVDRTTPGDTARTALEQVDEVRQLEPAVVVVGVGARELAAPERDLVAFRDDLSQLLGSIRSGGGPQVLLVGIVAPRVDAQAALDASTDVWNAALAASATVAGVQHVDVWSTWPRAGPERAALTDGAHLSDLGHVQVGTAVCDALVPRR